MIQKWDLSCGSAALGTLLHYSVWRTAYEKEIAQGLMSRPEYVGHPELVQAREGFSLLDLKRYMQNYCGAHYKGEWPRSARVRRLLRAGAADGAGQRTWLQYSSYFGA
jgi:hypothetical protein